MSVGRAFCNFIVGFIGSIGITAFSESAQAPKEKLVAFLEIHQKGIPFKSDFIQIKSVKEMGIELRSSGELEVLSAGSAKWTMLKPAYLGVEISPTEIKIFKTKGGTPQVFKKDSAASNDQAASWMKFLMDDPQTAMTHFEISEVSPLRFKLLPKDKKQGFDFLEIAFRNAKIKEQVQMHEVFIQENKEDSLRINFSKKRNNRKTTSRKSAQKAISP